MYFINSTPTLFKRVQMLRKLSRKIQIKPSQLLTSRLQVQTAPFTNCTCTMLSTDFLSLLYSGQKFEIQDNILKYEVRYSVNSKTIDISKKHMLYNEEFPLFIIEDSLSTFQVPKHAAQKICIIKNDVINAKIDDKSLCVEADDDVHLRMVITGIEHVSGNKYAEFRVRSTDMAFLSFFSDENMVLSIFETYLIFCFLDQESTTVARVPLLH